MNKLAVLRNVTLDGSDGNLLSALLEDGGWTVIAYARAKPSKELIELIRARTYAFSYVDAPKIDVSLLGRTKKARLLRSTIVNALAADRVVSQAVGGSLELALLIESCTSVAGPKYYLFSDLTRYHTNSNYRWALAIVERFLLRRGWGPVLTSPGFFSGYLRTLVMSPESLRFVHNCVMKSQTVFTPTSSCSEETPPTSSAGGKIVWTGLLRCGVSVEILNRLCESGLNRWRGELFGTIDRLPPAMQTVIQNSAGIKYLGRYAAVDLPEIYKSAAFAWCCDWGLPGNSEWLLPNRMYQAIEFGVPIVASAKSFVGQVVEAYGIGVVIEPDVESAMRVLANVDCNDYKLMVERVRELRPIVYGVGSRWQDILVMGGGRLNERHLKGFIFES